jgi:hypothetical protein
MLRDIGSVEGVCTYRHIPEYVDKTESCKVYRQPIYFARCPLLQKTLNKELTCSKTGSVAVFVSRHCEC